MSAYQIVTEEELARWRTGWVLTACGWVYDRAAEMWLTPDGERHVDVDEAEEWAGRTPMVWLHEFEPVELVIADEPLTTVAVTVTMEGIK